MASRLKRKLEAQPMQSIDMSPLLDVVFILLIFFIVSTVFVKETGVEVDKPQAISAQKLDQMSILIAITSNGEDVRQHQYWRCWRAGYGGAIVGSG